MDKQCEYLGCSASAIEQETGEPTKCWCRTVQIGWNEHGPIYVSKDDPVLDELHELDTSRLLLELTQGN